MKFEWFETDPRGSVDKSALIAVYIASAGLLTQAVVECKYGYYVQLTHLPPRGYIEGQTVDAGDTWPTGWHWCFLPE